MSAPPGGWEYWSVVLCKPDAVRRGLVDSILLHIGRAAELVARRDVQVSHDQILTHYADMLALDDRFGFDVAAELRRNYVGSRVVVALAHSETAGLPQRLRGLLGHYDPARARPDTIRGRLGIDSAARARAEGRFIDNLVHTSDDTAGAEREFTVWFGPAYRPVLSLDHVQESR
ncbi:hypothetical protein FZ103_10355 [Streptomonospora sp. PA3]|uniref:nucleoside-diphosphate kinase n=1 Tax=Streptomonospora sp. PA3 TaxID=2607326 RepID=UPI0012DBE59A|nr:nucleoside-diphosphate kinase [Streptomonospora sp. PA3]MUL41572.1 hypothetical protein [Streptomonospora sp. PA3]